MSLQARQELVENDKLHFTNASQKSDLLDPDITDTWLIQMLATLLDDCSEPIQILSVRTDHPSKDGSWAHSGGLAVDLYPWNWQMREETAVINVFKALAKNPYLWAVGLGGVTQQWQSYVTWPDDGKFVIFTDNASDHIHIDAANNGGGPGNREKV